MSATNAISTTISENGDERTWVIRVTNQTSNTCFSGQVTLTIPAGISLVGPEIPGSSTIAVVKGSFDPLTNIWYIGDIPGGAVLDQSLIFRVDDISLVDPVNLFFQIEAVFTSSCSGDDPCDNTTYFIMTPVDPCDEADLSAGTQDCVDCTGELQIV